MARTAWCLGTHPDPRAARGCQRERAQSTPPPSPPPPHPHPAQASRGSACSARWLVFGTFALHFLPCRLASPRFPGPKPPLPPLGSQGTLIFAADSSTGPGPALELRQPSSLLQVCVAFFAVPPGLSEVPRPQAPVASLGLPRHADICSRLQHRPWAGTGAPAALITASSAKRRYCRSFSALKAVQTRPCPPVPAEAAAVLLCLHHQQLTGHALSWLWRLPSSTNSGALSDRLATRAHQRPGPLPLHVHGGWYLCYARLSLRCLRLLSIATEHSAHHGKHHHCRRIYVPGPNHRAAPFTGPMPAMQTCHPSLGRPAKAQPCY
jgi:hypothetical protein